MCFPLDCAILRICIVLELLWVFSKYFSDRRVDERTNESRGHRLCLAGIPGLISSVIGGVFTKYNSLHCGIVTQGNGMLFCSLSLDIIFETQKGEVTRPGDTAIQCQVSLL